MQNWDKINKSVHKQQIYKFGGWGKKIEFCTKIKAPETNTTASPRINNLPHVVIDGLLDLYCIFISTESPDNNVAPSRSHRTVPRYILNVIFAYEKLLIQPVTCRMSYRQDKIVPFHLFFSQPG
jgi:hypothetical protein